MSYDIFITLCKKTHSIIDECNVAHLDLAVHSEHRVKSDAVGIVYRTGYSQKKYDDMLEKHGIDKSENILKYLWNVIESTDTTFRIEIQNPWQQDLFYRQNKKYTFLTWGNILGEITVEVKKSTDKEASVTKFLKILQTLQYCKREDLKYELFPCFDALVNQAEELWLSDRRLTSKLIVDILKVFCVADFIKIDTLLYSHFTGFFLRCSKWQKYDYCGIFEDTERDIYPIALFLMEGRLREVKLVLKHGARNRHSMEIHADFHKRLCSELKYKLENDWLFNLHIFNKRNYLVMQTIYLFTLIKQSEVCQMPTEILVLLWESVTDSFLTKLELWNGDLCYDDILRDCWKWYHRNVICRDTTIRKQHWEEKEPFNHYVVTPRSLKHFARCAIRKNWAANYFDPLHLNLQAIPQKLRKYLLIEFNL